MIEIAVWIPMAIVLWAIANPATQPIHSKMQEEPCSVKTSSYATAVTKHYILIYKQKQSTLNASCPNWK